MNYNTFKNKYFKENDHCFDYMNNSSDKIEELNKNKNDEDKLIFNTNLNVDYLADYFYKLYVNSLINDRLFAKQSHWDLVIFDFFELNAFKSHFKPFFKTAKQYRKTKHILSDSFTFRAKDMYDYYHTFYFCVDKKEFDKNGNDYLEDLQLYLSQEIEKQIEKIEKEKKEEDEEFERLKLKHGKV
ncbi:hypothetical protein HVF22_004682 [Salmonella enterica]|jgi:hypothetical protein|uniref:hypothetical protein n=1 Tax=Kluyvera ascorbata TaxID=51288 RepID=UPI002DBE26D8|nr:hypothetical protein [Kluyvera ascorbata]EFT4013602.1 hypothetical protein [Salmonella enterica]MEB6390933.1 hypothetical protein [Kluyvera ascorbata]HDK5459616.1 hypothetical protein [Klebsiella pneumoniae]